MYRSSFVSVTCSHVKHVRESMPGFSETIKRRYVGQQPGTMSGHRPADTPLINRWSTAGFVPPSVCIGIRVFVLPETCAGGFLSMVWRVTGTFVFWANRPVGVPSCPSPPRPAAPPCTAPSRPACGMSGFWIRQVGVHRISLVHASNETHEKEICRLEQRSCQFA